MSAPASAPLGSAQLGSAQLGSAPLGSAQLGSAQLGSAHLGSAHLGSAQLGSAQLGSAQLGSAQLGSAQLGSAQLTGSKQLVGSVKGASAPGKVVLFGEYAVLEGSPALVLASERSAHAWLERPLDDERSLCREGRTERGAEGGAERHYELWAPQLGEGSWRGELPPDAPVSERLERARLGERAGVDFAFAWAALCVINAPSGRYHVDTSAFGLEQDEGWQKLGLGSSAASTAALLKLCAQLKGAPLTPKRLYELTQLVHHHVQGSLGSGVDVVASAYGGLSRYVWRPSSAPLQPESSSLPSQAQEGRAQEGGAQTAQAQNALWEPLKVSAGPNVIGEAWAQPLNIALPHSLWVWMGSSASTPHLVREVQAAQKRQPHAWAEVKKQLAEAERAGLSALLTSPERPELRQRAWREAVSLGGEATRALSALAQAPVWSEAHERLARTLDELCEKGLCEGASLKPTGAGGGDLALVAAPSLEAHLHLKDALPTKGWRLIDL